MTARTSTDFNLSCAPMTILRGPSARLHATDDDVEKRGRAAHGSPMKHGSLFIIATMGALTACQSPTGLSQAAPAWSSTYQIPYDVMTNCLVERSRLPWVTVTAAFYAQERRATVTVTTPTGSALGIFTIEQISGRD